MEEEEESLLSDDSSMMSVDDDDGLKNLKGTIVSEKAPKINNRKRKTIHKTSSLFFEQINE